MQRYFIIIVCVTIFSASLTKDRVGVCIPNLNTNSQTGIYDNQ